MGIELEHRFPSIPDLKRAAFKRMPYFAWEYLDSGTGPERSIDRNIERLQSVLMEPIMCGGRFDPSLETQLFGQPYSVPFGVAPVGMSGLLWGGAERILAKAAAENRMPYTLSTVACEGPETIGPIAGDMGWFQLYPPSSEEIRKDLMQRAKDSGFKTLVMTLDIPIGSRRERQTKVGLSVPPKVDASMLYRVAKRPAWALRTLTYGKPSFRGLERYFQNKVQTSREMFNVVIDGRPDWDYVKRVRDDWDGPLIIKGMMDVAGSVKAVELGADGIVVSNHGARQFDATPASIDVLPGIKEAVGDRAKIIFDSGIRGGLDVIRAMALGADFCLLGRSFLYGVAALGDQGGEHVYHLLKEDMKNNMIQLAAKDLAALKDIPTFRT